MNSRLTQATQYELQVSMGYRMRPLKNTTGQKAHNFFSVFSSVKRWFSHGFRTGQLFSCLSVAPLFTFFFLLGLLQQRIRL